MKSEVKIYNNLPTLFVDGKMFPEIAYITYKLENSCYNDFAKNGYKLFSICLNFSEMPINESAPVLVMDKGIFEKDEPDFSIVDKNLELILNSNPEGLIFPRVNVNLPEKWEKSHPDELNDEGYGERCRASFSSDIWAEEVKKKLTLLINYIEKSKYKDNIVGYQIAGGNTDEWLPFDRNGNYSKRFREKYALHLEETGKEDNEANRFSFASEVVANRVIEFCTLAKELTGYQKIIGAFYGYSISGGHFRGSCHHALRKILECDVVDFLCAPITYEYQRTPGTDLFTQVPVDSLRVNNKFYLSENDIRTHNSRFIHDHPNYVKSLWLGPDKEKSIENLKLGFSRAFTHGYGMWWFDMWGGWYKDKEYMSIMKKSLEILSDGRDCPDNQVAVFIDEKGYTEYATASRTAIGVSHSMGLSGVSYDVFEKGDFEKVYKDYKAILFLRQHDLNTMEECIEKAKENNIATLVINEDKKDISPEELREFFVHSGVVVPVNKNAIVHTGKKFVCLYSLDNEETDFCYNGKRTFEDVFTNETYTFPTRLKENSCYLFKI